MAGRGHPQAGREITPIGRARHDDDIDIGQVGRRTATAHEPGAKSSSSNTRTSVAASFARGDCATRTHEHGPTITFRHRLVASDRQHAVAYGTTASAVTGRPRPVRLR